MKVLTLTLFLQAANAVRTIGKSQSEERLSTASTDLLHEGDSVTIKKWLALPAAKHLEYLVGKTAYIVDEAPIIDDKIGYLDGEPAVNNVQYLVEFDHFKDDKAPAQLMKLLENNNWRLYVRKEDVVRHEGDEGVADPEYVWPMENVPHSRCPYCTCYNEIVPVGNNPSEKNLQPYNTKCQHCGHTSLAPDTTEKLDLDFLLGPARDDFKWDFDFGADVELKSDEVDLNSDDELEK